MFTRGSKYWMWADCGLECLQHTECLESGFFIDVHVRKNREGRVQVFFGVYNELGIVIVEDFRDCDTSETETHVLFLATAQARRIAAAPDLAAFRACT